jgi:ATP-dependent protease ClpP protease subunit
MVHKIKLSGVVGIDIIPQAVEKELADIGLSQDDTLIVEVNSPGGIVPDGFTLYNMFNNLKCEVIFDITGIAMSIMSLIILAGDKIKASPVSLLMIHKASTGLEGNADELRRQAETLDKIDGILIELYFKRNQEKGKKKLSREELEAMLSAETFMSPEDGEKYGFIDELTGKVDMKIAAQMKDLITNNKSHMKHLDRLRKLLALGSRPEITNEAVKDAFVKALGKRKIKALSDEETAEVVTEVETVISEVVGDSLTEQEAEQVKAAIDAAVEEMKTAEGGEEGGEPAVPQEEIEMLRQELAALKELVQASAQANVELADTVAESVTDIKSEIVALQRGTRSFSKKPFVNETTKVNFGGQYVDPYAKHRKEMAEIEARTRQAKLKNV